MARRKRSEASLDKVLGEIEELKARERMTQENAWAVRRGHLGPTQLGQYPTAEAIAAAEGREEYLATCDAHLEELAAAISERWALAAGLSDGSDRLAGSDEEIQTQIGALVEQRRSLDGLAGRHRENAHELVDEILREKRELLERLLDQPLSLGEVQEVAGMWAWRDPSLEAALHAAVDARPDAEFSPGARSSWQAEHATIARQIARREKELALREQERAAASAEQARKAAEEELAAVAVES